MNENVNVNRAPDAVGHIPSGLFVVCAKDVKSGEIDGFLGSWVQQSSFSPLRISLCVKPGRPASDRIIQKEIFSVNIVGEHEKQYLKHFWQGYDPSQNPFLQIAHHQVQGAIVLDQAKSALICRACEIFTPGDHVLVIADVLESVINNAEAKSKTHVRSSGMIY
jgi:flavin reductase (DIM6/NTAB) family NADH-FMN oxidoreductase RutF